MSPISTFLTPSAPVKITKEIYKKEFKNFFHSVTSSQNEFSDSDVIKAYAYNTSFGIIRNYNEDTITVEKNKEGDFYFFGIYDGHGGGGCSKYLQENLHLNITEFSVQNIIDAIDITEKNFLENIAISKNCNIFKNPKSLSEVYDRSGSTSKVLNYNYFI